MKIISLNPVWRTQPFIEYWRKHPKAFAKIEAKLSGKLIEKPDDLMVFWTDADALFSQEFKAFLLELITDYLDDEPSSPKKDPKVFDELMKEVKKALDE